MSERSSHPSWKERQQQHLSNERMSVWRRRKEEEDDEHTFTQYSSSPIPSFTVQFIKASSSSSCSKKITFCSTAFWVALGTMKKKKKKRRKEKTEVGRRPRGWESSPNKEKKKKGLTLSAKLDQIYFVSWWFIFLSVSFSLSLSPLLFLLFCSSCTQKL